MSKFPPLIECAFCGARKGATNHWYLLSAQVHQVFAYTQESREAPEPFCGNIGEREQLAITDFDLAEAEDPSAAPACGSRCVQHGVERWLQTRSLAQPRSPASEPANARKESL